MRRWGRRWLTLPGQPMPGPAGTRRVGGRYVPTTRRVWQRGPIRFKSRYEYNYSLFLDYVGLTWVYEARTFIFHRIQSGTRVYTPDFYLPTRDEYHECKGYLDRRSRVQLKRMRIYYPHVKVVVIDHCFFQQCEAKGVCRLIEGYACRHHPERL
jgi:hypothetical protein